VPIHLFQEGDVVPVRKAFRLLALRSGGTYSEFSRGGSFCHGLE
jgi:hypothetical protein